MSPHLHRSLRLLILLAAVLLGLGLVAPCMTVHPGFGPMDSWVRLLKPDLAAPSRYSILGGIVTLLQGGNRAIGLLLLGFSVVFPTVKLAMLVWASERLYSGHAPGWMLRIAHHAGKWSMLDVLVLAVLVIAIEGLPGTTTVSLGWGIYAFAGAVATSLIASALLARAERRSRAS